MGGFSLANLLLLFVNPSDGVSVLTVMVLNTTIVVGVYHSYSFRIFMCRMRSHLHSQVPTRLILGYFRVCLHNAVEKHTAH